MLPSVLIISLYRLSTPGDSSLVSIMKRVILLLCLIIAFLYSFLYLSESSEKYSLDYVYERAYQVYYDLRYHESYYLHTGGGSIYDVGEFKPTLEGVLEKFPIAFTTALFRPFIWESSKIVILLPAIENLIMTLLMGYLAYKYGIIIFLKKVVQNKWSLAFMLFCVVFLFMVGLTSGNFGNLVRYRVPGIFFFYIILFATYGEIKYETYHSGGRQ
ncbi:MAG: hypothetical protein RMJ66_06245, partial [Bacteroidia bacterium]|nr:hypothetical protein [Bacteroidia bacterium]